MAVSVHLAYCALKHGLEPIPGRQLVACDMYKLFFLLSIDIVLSEQQYGVNLMQIIRLYA